VATAFAATSTTSATSWSVIAPVAAATTVVAVATTATTAAATTVSAVSTAATAWTLAFDRFGDPKWTTIHLGSFKSSERGLSVLAAGQGHEDKPSGLSSLAIEWDVKISHASEVIEEGADIRLLAGERNITNVQFHSA